MKWLNSNRIRLVVIGLVAVIMLCSKSTSADFTFGTPKILGMPVNSGYYDGSPCISSDGLELYFASTREDGYGLDDIWVSTRQTTDDEWGEPNNLGELINSSLSEYHPSISSDGLELYMEVWEPAPSGSYYISGGIYIIKRATRNDPWSERVMLDIAVPSGYLAASPSISADGLELYFAMCRFGEDDNEADIYVTTRETASSPWGEPVSLGPVVNNWNSQVSPMISSDGLLLLFKDWWAGSPRPEGFGSDDIWFSRRTTKDADWSEPVNLGAAINTAFADTDGMISADGSTLYFSSNRYSALFYNVRTQYHLYQAPILPVVDFDDDGILAINDLLMLIENWGTDDPKFDIGPMPWGDGVVDAADLEALMKYWGKDVNAPSEPLAHWKLDESEGIIAYDSAGDNDATLVGEPIWQPTGGWLDGSLELDGVDDGAQASFVLNPSESPFSAFAWVKGGGPDQVIISQAMGDIGRGVNWLLTDSAEGNLMSEFNCLDEDYSPGIALLSSIEISDGLWHHVGLVWDLFNGTRILYVDGIEVAKDMMHEGGLLMWEDGGINIGFQASILHRPGYWSGLIDDVRIYDRALSAEEIAALAQ